jgi:photosystem II stability/assembly factor-like uncharacterized protein
MPYRVMVILFILVWLLSGCQIRAASTEPVVPTDLPGSLASAIPATEPESTEAPTQETPPVTATLTSILPEENEKLVWAYTETDVYRSTDGGQSWQKVTPSGLQENLNAAGEQFGVTLMADFSDENFGLTVISQVNQALIYRTEDGGKTWEESVLSYAEDVQGIVSVDTLDGQYGWLLVSRGLGAGNEWVDLYHTQDGGVSWSHLAWSSTEADPYGSIPSGGLKSGIRFSDPRSGWIAGSAPIDAVYLLHSQDGGQTWQPYHLPLPDGVAFSGPASPPIFFDELQGVLTVGVYTVTDEPGLVFFWTEDGGQNWQPSAVLEGRFTAQDWVDPQHGFVVEANDYNQTKLLATQDGGLTWEAYPIQMAMVSRMEFVTAQAGWAICGSKDAPGQGCAGELYQTVDGGRSWEIVSP